MRVDLLIRGQICVFGYFRDRDLKLIDLCIGGVVIVIVIFL